MQIFNRFYNFKDYVRMNHKIILKAILSLLLLAEVSFGGAWTQKKGSGYFQLGSQIIRANEFYEPDGNKIDITTLGDYTITIYGEYGVTENFTLFGSFPVLRRLTLNRIEGKTSGFEYFPGDSKTGVSDFDIGIKYGLARFGSTVLSASLSFGIPVGDNTQINGLYTGDGEWNQQISVGLGHSFSAPIYLSADVGFNNRVEGFSDEMRYNFEIGYNWRKFLFIFKASGVETLRNGADEVLGGSGGLFANNQQYLIFGPEIVYNFNDSFGFNAGAVTATRAQNVVSGIAYRFGAFFKVN
jgi:hypothetical protein